MKIGILTSGGDCPGLNAVIRGAVLKGTTTYDLEFVVVAQALGVPLVTNDRQILAAVHGDGDQPLPRVQPALSFGAQRHPPGDLAHGVVAAEDVLDLPGMAGPDAPAEPAVTDPDHPHPGQWRLTHVQISNWGTFHGTHDLAISSKGFFLTGGPGTGKSTLLDAISALLTPPRTLQFNAAASDAGPQRSKYRRTVASYVRGAWAMHYDQATGEFSQEVLREKTTLSVLTLRYGDGRGGTREDSALQAFNGRI